MTAPDDSELSPGTEADYAVIEAAVMETARGRWFLAEYARRNRTADTETLLAAILRLEDKMEPQEAAPAGADARLGHVGRTAERIRDVAWQLKRRHGATDEAADLERLVGGLLAAARGEAPVDEEEAPETAAPAAEEAAPAEIEAAPPAPPEPRRPRLPREIDLSSLSFEDRMALVS